MPSEIAVHVAIELSSSSWLVATRLPGAEKSRVRRIQGGNTTGLLALLVDSADKLRSSWALRLTWLVASKRGGMASGYTGC
jgi:hypothetical protein